MTTKFVYLCNLSLFNILVSSLIWESRSLPSHQISAIYLNSRLIYYYFRFLKTNVRHVEILPPVPIFMFASPSACRSASAHQISFESATQLWCHIHFSRWRPRHRNSTSGFGFREFAHLRRSKSTCTPNLGEITQSTAAVTLW